MEAGVEFYSTRRTHDAVSRADVGVLVVDAVEGITDQDQRIAREVYEAGRAVVCAVNKWDLLNGYTPEQIHRVAQQRLRFVPDVQVCLTVATQRRGIGELMAAVFRAARARASRIATGPLNRALEEALRANQPPSDATGDRAVRQRSATAHGGVPALSRAAVPRGVCSRRDADPLGAPQEEAGHARAKHAVTRGGEHGTRGHHRQLPHWRHSHRPHRRPPPHR
ncbi:MAG: hypothetical protein E6H03_09620 [Bacillati bacterium ANGP1]|uniref:Tr-type G domain-containing protein n=1 Tax=Candidatus Segetimicrobium genomatis TaxID=2569760 RepID=A0A537J8G1_9BACT|nr:MAG: hypothetical protein E6H03_09620 [Terrabacteria group bacterium ANGP1]